MTITEKINWEKIHRILSKEPKTTERTAHYINPPKKHKPQTPSRAIFFDSESIVHKDNYQHEPYLLAANFVDYAYKKVIKKVYGSEKARQKSKDIIDLKIFWLDIDKFTRQRETLWIFAHNIGYDLLATGGLQKLFEIGYVSISYPYENGATFIFEIARKNPNRFCSKCKIENPCEDCIKKPVYINKIKFVSTTNYYNTSLKNLGDIFGLEKTHQKQEEKFDFSKLDEYDINKVIDYCVRDTDIIQVAMESLFEQCKNGEVTKFGSFKNTLPAMSFSAFQTWFIKPNQLHVTDNNLAINLERNAYFGGRTEVWKRGIFKETIIGVDINSMYPSIMLKNKFPTQLLNTRSNISVAELKRYINRGYLVTAEVIIKTESENPYPMRYNNRLVFPIGKFETTISTPEVIYALERDHIIKVKNVAIYKADYIFKDFVQHFYTARQKNRDNPVLNYLFKLILNSLYGKFGQLKREWIEVGESNFKTIKTEEQIIIKEGIQQEINLKTIGGKIYCEEPFHDVAYNSIVAIASHVTSYARILLYNLINIAGKENHYYNDTDSLYCNIQGFKNLEKKGLIDDKKLGALAIEEIVRPTEADPFPEDIIKKYNIPDKKLKTGGFFLNAKDYKIGEKRKLKGISADAEKIGENTYKQLQWTGFKTALRTQNITSYQNREIIKHVSEVYCKGWFGENNEVIPLEFNGEQLLEPKQKINLEIGKLLLKTLKGG